MPNSQLITLFVQWFTLFVLIFCVSVVWRFFRAKHAKKMNVILDYIHRYSTTGEGDPATLLALFANSLTGQEKLRAINGLIALAGDGNTKALEGIRDHISTSDLRDALRRMRNGDLYSHALGNTVGGENCRKLECFYLGTRNIRQLTNPIVPAERQTLNRRFDAQQAEYAKMS